MDSSRLQQAQDLMAQFARRTGIGALPAAARRYLWTDAFAVGNFLTLHRATGDVRHRELALCLVDDVHQVLGHHRPDDARTGWISGLAEDEGRRRPTAGGLRIGKPLPERAAGVPADERREWEQDGQYFHYLTKWMQALDQLADGTGDERYARWACELMVVAHRAFVHTRNGGAGRAMYWKMSIDLSRPLVPSMGQHDPLDGLVTCVQLQAGAARLGADASALARARQDFAALTDRRSLATGDPLGLGGLLVDACRLEHLGQLRDLRDDVLAAAVPGLRHYLGNGDLQLPARVRLAFRELGLAIGLAAAGAMVASARPCPGLDAVRAFLPLRAAIEGFWLAPANRQAPSWLQHQDINDVMLAASLLA